MLSNKDIAALQKTYDHSYLSCSTAVYYEGQGDESEATLHWRAALRRINEYYASTSAPRVSESYTDTDAALIDALKELELQCKERIDLLEALKLSRQDSLTSTYRDDASPTAQASDGASQGAGTIGQGTIPAVTYSELSRPSFSSRTSLEVMTSSEEVIRRVHSTPADPTQRAYSRPNQRTPDMPDTRSDRTNRPPSPERHTMRTTLRSKKTNDRPAIARRSSRPAADGPSKAATIAWSSSGSRDNLLRPFSVEGRSTKSSPTPRQSLERSSPNSQKSIPSYDSKSPRTSPQKWGLVPSSDEPRLPQPSVLSISAASSALTSSSSYQEPSMSYQTPSKSEQNVTPRKLPVSEQLSTQSKRASAKACTASNTGISEGKRDSSTPRGQRIGVDSPVLSKPDKERGNGYRYDGRQASPMTSTHNAGAVNLKSNSELANLNPAEGCLGEEPLNSTMRGYTNDKSPKAMTKAAILKNLPPGVDEGAAKQILNDIVVQGDEVHWSDIAGLEIAKNSLREAVVYPFLRPDLFMGLREPARGMLLFGPPGTGKTMLARAVATESKSTFFSISASSLTSKYLGESEKLVRALFGLSKALAPSIIFVDEIDSLLSQRSESGEHEATRRIKTEFLIQWSELQRAAAGREMTSKTNTRSDAQRVLVLAATNLPWAIDEAARRRFVRRQYIPLPEPKTREIQLKTLLRQQNHSLSDEDTEKLVQLTDGFSGSDITALAKDAAMGPLRSLGEALLYMTKEEIRPIDLSDFELSLKSIRPSVDQDGLREYEEWAEKFGERGG
ncbi:P-loop containing nucleoside triphosphate hydrolase protein [Trichoderma ceciliae]